MGTDLPERLWADLQLCEVFVVFARTSGLDGLNRQSSARCAIRRTRLVQLTVAARPDRVAVCGCTRSSCRCNTTRMALASKRTDTELLILCFPHRPSRSYGHRSTRGARRRWSEV